MYFLCLIISYQDKFHWEMTSKYSYLGRDETNHEYTWRRSFQQRRKECEGLLIQTMRKALLWFWSIASTLKPDEGDSKVQSVKSLSWSHKIISTVDNHNVVHHNYMKGCIPSGFWIY